MAGLYILETLYVWPRLTPGKPAAFIDEVGIGVVVRAFCLNGHPEARPIQGSKFQRVTRSNFDRLRHIPSGEKSAEFFNRFLRCKALTRLDQNPS